MSELVFCKSLLTALDARPVKLSSDHIADQRQYPAQGAYTLPRLPHPPHPSRPLPKSSSATSSSSSTLTLTLKPMKPSFPTLPLSSIDPSKTSIYDLKSAYATHGSLNPTKIKILYKKKPVADAKTVGDVVGSDGGAEVEFGVMVMAGAEVGTPVASPPAVVPSEMDKGLAGAGAGAGAGEGGPAAQGPSGKEVVATEEFWSDLKNFIMQRTRDETEAERLVGLFRGAWESSK